MRITVLYYLFNKALICDSEAVGNIALIFEIDWSILEVLIGDMLGVIDTRFEAVERA